MKHFISILLLAFCANAVSAHVSTSGNLGDVMAHNIKGMPVLDNESKGSFSQHLVTAKPEQKEWAICYVKKKADKKVKVATKKEMITKQKKRDLKFTKDDKEISVKERSTTDNVLDVAPKMPEYPGGITALKKFFDSHINYPADAKQKKVKGFVVLKFIVEKDGSISNITVIKKGKLPSLDKEAVRVCKLVKGFKPARDENNNAVRVYFTYPVSFDL